jgi:UDP-N-acetylmuramate: L-alanyl-gamma-D-glutamyl-meso-diaminopimelate ligase
VVLVPPFDTSKIPEEERFDSTRLVKALQGRGMDAALCDDADVVVELLAGELGAGDVVLVMSNGAFDGIHDKLLAAFGERKGS